MRSFDARKAFMVPDKALLSVEVVYALPDRQVLLPLEVEPGTTVCQAIEQSGIRRVFPHIDPERGRVGIFGRLVNQHAVLRNGDRIEIYRPLIADPKDSRRRRARKTR